VLVAYRSGISRSTRSGGERVVLGEVGELLGAFTIDPCLEEGLQERRDRGVLGSEDSKSGATVRASIGRVTSRISDHEPLKKGERYGALALARARGASSGQRGATVCARPSRDGVVNHLVVPTEGRLR
jgi:hypothetical protein